MGVGINISKCVLETDKRLCVCVHTCVCVLVCVCVWGAEINQTEIPSKLMLLDHGYERSHFVNHWVISWYK